MNFAFHPEARMELFEAADWYEREVPGLGADFNAEFERSLNLLLADPQRWRKIEADIRRCLMRRFPYNIIYDIRGDCLRIIAVAHQHREPGYWRARLA